MSWKTERYPTDDEVVEFVARRGAVTTFDVARLAQSGPTKQAKAWARLKMAALLKAGRVGAVKDPNDKRRRVFVPKEVSDAIED